MYAEVAWALESLGTQVQPQIIPDPGYLPDYLSVSYDYAFLEYSLLRSSYFFFRLVTYSEQSFYQVATS